MVGTLICVRLQGNHVHVSFDVGGHAHNLCVGILARLGCKLYE